MGYLAPPPAPAPVIVLKDVGGLVSDYEARTEQYRRENREVRLHECRSACTLALSLPNVCVYPDAKVKFHQAYNALTREVDLGVSARLFSSYPAAVQGRLGYLTREYRVLSGTELIALGMRNCNGGGGEGRVMIAGKKPAPQPPLAGSNPLGDLAQNVRTAVASAWSRPDDSAAEPIRVGVPDRRPVPPTLARLSGEASGRLDERRLEAGRTDVASLEAPRGGFGAPDEAGVGPEPKPIPLPPRRPPSLSFRVEDAAPSPTAYTRLMPGAQPILSNARFVAVAGGVR